MRALFWNIRGFGHDGRRRQLVEYMRDEHIDIVAVQETMRRDFAVPELDRLSSHLFAWHWLPSSGSAGHSGGILLGVKDATFEVGSIDRGQFFVSMELYERALKFQVGGYHRLLGRDARAFHRQLPGHSRLPASCG